jgi:hypothetical protein
MHYTVPMRDQLAEGARPCPYSPSEPAFVTPVVGPADYSVEDLRDTLLAALVVLASKSRRRQADLSAALRRMNLPVTADQVMAALQRLREEGCVQDWMPLYDGGMLVSVTNRGMDQTNRIGSWRFLEQLHAITA